MSRRANSNSSPHGPDNPDPLYRLLAFLRPDEYACEELLKLARIASLRFGLTGWPLAFDRLHLSLCCFWQAMTMPSSRIIQFAGSRCSDVASETSPFEVIVNQLKSFSEGEHRKPLVLCPEHHNRHLSDLFCDIHGMPEEKAESFHPHVTLLYDSGSVKERRVDPISWIAGEIVLVVSHVGQTRYDEIGRWRFQG